ncbi:DUF3558 family protein [Saccharopolyspora cebuensis]|uniref:DUF3558 family protein n=1 Tax=Saccharopolyspora cebuensis TaxID=418759 RepID=A0ABV4CRX0_9PSEU
MSSFFRSARATMVGIAVLGAAACAGPTAGDDRTQPEEAPALAGFDPCTFFAPEELSSFGVGPEAEEFTPVSFEPGCKWNGEDMDLTFQKNEDESVQSYATSNWDSYTEAPLAGRTAAIAVPAGGTDQGVCEAVVDTGGGVVLYGITAAFGSSVDACGEVEAIAERTASRLPE